jgi:hypothetical protein
MQFLTVMLVLFAAKTPNEAWLPAVFHVIVFPLQSSAMLLAPNVMHDSFADMLSLSVALELSRTGQPGMLLNSLKDVTSNSSTLLANVTFWQIDVGHAAPSRNGFAGTVIPAKETCALLLNWGHLLELMPTKLLPM